MDRREMLKGATAMLPAYIGLPPGLCEAEALRQSPKPYDPVAVLEAMRERGLLFDVTCNDGRYWPSIMPPGSQLGDHTHGFGISPESFPDFRSAVLWLHRQAAADPDFAAAWPVPEGE